MTYQDLLPVFREKGCFPHQAEFAAKFFAERAAAYHLLAGSPGLGKGHLASVLADYAIAEHSGRRVLVLAPPSLCPMWSDMLRRQVTTVPVLAVSGAAFRELEDAVPVGQSAWPEGIVAVLSMDLAPKKEIAASLASVSWDLVIVDEAHRMMSSKRTQRAELLRVLLEGGAVRRLLLMTATPPGGGLVESTLTPNSSVLPHVETTTWHHTVRSWDGTPLAAPGSQWKIAVYRRSADEITFHWELQRVLQGLSAENRAARMFCRTLQQRAASSIFAIEQSLQGLQSKMISRRSEIEDRSSQFLLSEDELDNEESEDTRGQDSGQFPWNDRAAGLQVVAACLGLLDKVATDEKLQTLLGLVKQLAEEHKDGPPAICVISSFADTVQYIHAAAQDWGVASLLLTGSNDPEERKSTIDRFSAAGGLLIGTDSALVEGIGLPDAPHVIHYDLPATPTRMEARRGRFNRLGRTEPCLFYAFRDESNVIPDEEKLVRQYTGFAGNLDKGDPGLS